MPLRWRAALLLLLVGAARLCADSFTFNGDKTTMSFAEGGQHALLTGNARVETTDLRITADSIELFGKDFIYAQCHGNVRVVDAKRGLDLSSQDLFYDRDRKIARIKGNAMMADLKNQMEVKGGFIEDRDTEQITIIQIGVRIFKNDITCRAEFAKYSRDTKILELSGMPWVSKAGDVYQAARITINLDTEDISLEGDVKGSFEDKGTKASGPGEASPAAPDKGPSTAPAGTGSVATPSPAGSSQDAAPGAAGNGKEPPTKPDSTAGAAAQDSGAGNGQ